MHTILQMHLAQIHEQCKLWYVGELVGNIGQWCRWTAVQLTMDVKANESVTGIQLSWFAANTIQQYRMNVRY